jgi:hypothetical protein
MPLLIQRYPWRLILSRGADISPVLTAKDQFRRFVTLANETRVQNDFLQRHQYCKIEKNPGATGTRSRNNSPARSAGPFWSQRDMACVKRPKPLGKGGKAAESASVIRPRRLSAASPPGWKNSWDFPRREGYNPGRFAIKGPASASSGLPGAGESTVSGRAGRADLGSQWPGAPRGRGAPAGRGSRGEWPARPERPPDPERRDRGPVPAGSGGFWARFSPMFTIMLDRIYANVLKSFPLERVKKAYLRLPPPPRRDPPCGQGFPGPDGLRRGRPERPVPPLRRPRGDAPT